MKTNYNPYFISFDSNDSLTLLLKEKEVYNLNELLSFAKTLPYGRNKNRIDLSLVLFELQGTCSSKHAFVKEIVNRNKIYGVELILGIYKMNGSNTKNIGAILENTNLDYIPEAHCYLKIDKTYIDITTKNSDIEMIREAIIEERTIDPEQVGTYKVEYHQSFLKKWLAMETNHYTFDEIWSIREQCILALSK